MGNTRRSPGARGASTRPGGSAGGGARSRPAGPAGPRPAAAARRGASALRRPTLPGAFARRSTRRLAMLGGVFVLLAVMLVPPLRAYLLQQQEFRDLQTSVVQQQSRVEDLERRKQQWQDPAYVEQQSRDRLRYVRPGETSYVVVGAESLRDKMPRGSLSVIDPASGEGPQAWYAKIWDSVQTGDSIGTDPQGAPVSRLDGGTSSDAPSDVTTGAPVEPPRLP